MWLQANKQMAATAGNFVIVWLVSLIGFVRASCRCVGERAVFGVWFVSAVVEGQNANADTKACNSIQTVFSSTAHR